MTAVATPLPSASPIAFDDDAGPGPHVTFTEDEFCRWIAAALPGSCLEYHRGFLATDRMPSTSPYSPDQRNKLVAVAKRALQMAEDGRLHLVQKRHGDGDYSYIAIKVRPRRRRVHAVPARARGGR